MMRQLQTAAYGVLILGIALLPLFAQQGAKEGQWRAYASENGSTGYSPSDLINRDNVKNLQVAWSWKFDNFGATNTEVTPIMVNGILYFPLSPRRTIVAADAGTGETLGHGDLLKTTAKRGPPARTRAASATGRMEREERIVTITPGFRLVALDLKTGTPVPSFGTTAPWISSKRWISISPAISSEGSATVRRPSFPTASSWSVPR